MFGKSFQVFKLFGFSVRVDLSWFIIVLLVTWTLATAVFPSQYKGEADATYWWMGLFASLGLFASIVLHELSHSLVARRFGLEIKGITLFIFGGVAEMESEPPSPKVEFLVAIAGPIASVAVAATCLALALAIPPAAWSIPAVGVLHYLAFINFILVVFNLVPAFPLDGGRVLRSILWQYWGSLNKATRVTAAMGSGFGMVLILLGVMAFITGNVIGGMWQFLIGLFLQGAAAMSYQQLLVRRVLEGETVSRFMQSDVITVPPSVTIQQLLDEFVYKHHHKMYPVTEHGRLLGCVTTHHIKPVPREEREWRTVREILAPCSAQNTISPDADATQALAKMSQIGHSRLMVVDDGQLTGVVGLRDMLKFIALKIELEEDGAADSRPQNPHLPGDAESRKGQFVHR